MSAKAKPSLADSVETNEASEDLVVESGEALKRRYQSVLREPVPPRLSALINRLRVVEKSLDR